MKVIDLLNKIANGEEIKEFKYYGHIFEYDIDSRLWKNEDGAIFSTYCYVEDCLNDEVEIIEEENKIPEKLVIYDDSINWCYNGRAITDTEKDIIDKINKIIDCLKSKGE